MVPSVNFTLKWLEIIVPHLILFPSSELQSSTRKTKSEDPEASNSETASSSFPFSGLHIVLVKEDTETSSEPPDPTHSANDLDYLI